MSRYKFIGTEKQLLEHGFRLVIDYEIKAIKNIDNSRNVYIGLDGNIGTWKDEDIQDLIDAKLVEVVQE